MPKNAFLRLLACAVSLLISLFASANVSPGDLLVSGRFNNQVTQYGASSGTFLSVFSATGISHPVGIAYGPDRNLYVANVDSNSILKFNGLTGAPMGTFASGGGLNSPRAIAFGPDENLYVTSAINGEVIRYNGSTGAFMDVFASGHGLAAPVGLAFGPDHSFYVNNALGNAIFHWAADGTYIGVFASGTPLNNPTYMAFGSDGNLYVANFNTNSVLEYNGSTGAYIKVFASGNALNGPIPLAFGPDGNLYVGSANTNNVYCFNGTTGAFIDVFASGGGLQNPNGIAFAPANMPTDWLSGVSAPSAIFGSRNAFGTVTLKAPAGSNGFQVMLGTDNPSIASVPASVTVPAGKTSASFLISTKAVSANTVVNVNASDGFVSNSVPVTVTQFDVPASITLPTTIVGGTTGTGSVSLIAPAPKGGVSVSLTSQVPASAGVPASMTVPAGAQSAGFTVTAEQVSYNQNVWCSAALAGTTKWAKTEVLISDNLSTFGVSQNLVGGSIGSGTAHLATAAPSSGILVFLKSSNTSALTVPSSVKVTSGHLFVKFALTTKTVTASTPVSVTASDGMVTLTGQVNVLPAQLVSIASPASIKGGTSGSATVTLANPAPAGGLVISLSVDQAAIVKVPGTVTVVAGKTSATFTFTAVVVTANTTVTFNASDGAVTHTSQTVVTP